MSYINSMKRIVLIASVLMIGLTAGAQGSYFGVKGGMSIGSQKWNNFERDLLYKYHIAAFIESNSEEGNREFYAQLGYHTRGSAIRVNGAITQNGVRFSPPVQELIFNNISLGFGVKQKFYGASSLTPYYSIGLRAEYTIKNNILDLQSERNIFYSSYYFEEFVQKFVYGVSAGGGIEYQFSEFVGAFLEISLQPDIGAQYNQPFPIENVINPRNPGGAPIRIGPRQVRNFNIEISVGVKFLRKVIYIE